MCINWHRTMLVSFAACDTECCQSGGHCGSPVFDTCSGSWDYRTSCSPGYDTCCMPARVETTQVMTQRPPTPEAQTTNLDDTLPPVRSTAGSDTSFPPPVLGMFYPIRPLYYFGKYFLARLNLVKGLHLHLGIPICVIIVFVLYYPSKDPFMSCPTFV